jgi:hypothetical protein
MKVFKNQNPSILFWLPTGTYHKNLAIWKKNSWKTGEFGSFFP